MHAVFKRTDLQLATDTPSLAPDGTRRTLDDQQQGVYTDTVLSQHGGRGCCPGSHLYL